MEGKFDQQSELGGSISGYSQTSTPIGIPGLRRSLSQGEVPMAFLPKPKERTSWVWKHGTLYQALDRNGIIKDRWRCNLCKKPDRNYNS